jgi:hypothetical protein
MTDPAVYDVFMAPNALVVLLSFNHTPPSGALGKSDSLHTTKQQSGFELHCQLVLVLTCRISAVVCMQLQYQVVAAEQAHASSA